MVMIFVLEWCEENGDGEDLLYEDGEVRMVTVIIFCIRIVS